MSTGYIRNETTMKKVDIELDDSFVIQNSMYDCLFVKNTDVIKALKNLDYRYEYEICMEMVDEDDEYYKKVSDESGDVVNVYIPTRVVEEFLTETLRVNIDHGNKVGVIDRPYDEDTCCPFCGSKDMSLVQPVSAMEIMNCHSCREDFIAVY
jgi:hypothetical protein